jgi:hypothetical protein
MKIALLQLFSLHLVWCSESLDYIWYVKKKQNWGLFPKKDNNISSSSMVTTVTMLPVSDSNRRCQSQSRGRSSVHFPDIHCCGPKKRLSASISQSKGRSLHPCCSSAFKLSEAVVAARMLRRMPFLTQPSQFPGLRLAPPMAPITVEAGNFTDKDKNHFNN